MRSVTPVVMFVLGLALGAIGATSRSSGWFADRDVEPRSVARTTDAGIASGSPLNQRCPDEAQLRRVIREELAAAAGSPDSVPDLHPADAGPRPTVSSDAQAHVELVNRHVDDYIRAGAISDSEMVLLQSEIATLDPAARTAAMQKLVRAMNSGALDGRL
jgi:hypothetical protein